jgi:hypothetical protein
MFRSSDHDPLAAAIAPPKNESTAARAVRLRAEAEARRISDEIDEQLKQDRASRRRQRPCVKVLLLGQSESGTFRASSYPGTSFLIHRHMLSCLGKSTTLKSECPFISPHHLPGSPFGLVGCNALISGGMWSHISDSYYSWSSRYTTIDLFQLKRSLYCRSTAPLFYFLASLALPSGALRVHS